MGKALSSATKLQAFARVASERLKRAKVCGHPSVKPPNSKPSPFTEGRLGANVPADYGRRRMEGSGQRDHQRQRLPLSDVVADCVRRWFEDTLKEAKAGDTAMQVLVGQMYYSGYGVPKNPQKGKFWISKAAHSRSSVWKVCNKRPGYNASDSDSDENNEERK